MNNFTTNTYEMKREILNFSKKIAKKLSKSEKKFIQDIEYGIAASGSCLISDISRSLNEDIKLKNTIERLCDNLNSFDDTETLYNNYIEEIGDIYGKEPVVLFDDSDISKVYGKKFEDLDDVIDASSQDKKVTKGYHVCEATILTEKENQLISVYSQIYSCKSKDFKSMNDYTFKSIEAAKKVLNRKFIGVFDRGYDDNKIIDYMDDNYFVIRMNDRRVFLFKGKKKNVYEEAKKRKGKIRMTLWFDDNEEYEVYISHTKVTLPHNGKDYELVFCYGLSEERPLILLTNRKIHSKDDVIKVVRLYFSRWRIEEYFRAKKQEYKFENIRLRTLKGINNLNLFLTIHLGHINKLAEEINRKLLSIKIIEASKSIRNKVIIWMSQFARGIKKILSYAHTGIKEWQKIEIRDKYKQLALKI
ncbi:MAG: transposase [Mollicutes bacterium]|nr:transposase [Mollicutes bacterium]